MKLINIGFGNLVSAERLIAVVSPDSAPIKRMVQENRERGMLIDATYGRKTASIFIMDSGHVVLSALPPERLQAEAHTQAEEALAEIYAILEDPELDDPACMQKIEAIVTVYHRRLGVHSTRHWEQD